MSDKEVFNLFNEDIPEFLQGWVAGLLYKIEDAEEVNVTLEDQYENLKDELRTKIAELENVL